MTSKNLLRCALVSAVLACASTAFAADAAASAPAAKGTGNKQNHHCKLADGSMDMGKTHKACVADKGTWVKDGASAPAAAASAAPKK